IQNICPEQGGTPASVQTIQIEVVNPETITGSVKIAAEGKTPYVMNQTITAKWMGGTCGDMPPAVQASSQTAPITATFARVGNNYSLHVTNHSGSALTAYSLLLYTLNNESRRFYDAKILGSPSIAPGASFAEGLPGTTVGLSRVDLLAAVFADGTSIGDP